MSLGNSILGTIHTCIVGFVQESINTDTSEWGKIIIMRLISLNSSGSDSSGVHTD